MQLFTQGPSAAVDVDRSNFADAMRRPPLTPRVNEDEKRLFEDGDDMGLSLMNTRWRWLT